MESLHEHPFAQFKLNKQLLSAISDLNYSSPTPIQEKAIPLALAGHDVLGIAQTGTGKTAAYLIPVLMKIKFAQGEFPRCLILVPTRELAIQIGEQISLLGKYTDLRYVCVYGGLGPKTQKELLSKGVDILVGTPGRVMELYLKGDLMLKDIKIMVLDEADRMMDMGFMPQIRRILEVVPRKRQNLLFSATMPESVLKLSEEFLEFPEKVEITPQSTTAQSVTQGVYFVPNIRTKANLLLHLLSDTQTFHKVIVFTRTKENANNIFKFLQRKAEGELRVIHANKGQNTRINAIEEFKKGTVRILVATDVAARGIDVSMVSHVINFDVPILYEEYVHRIGRTGRAFHTGVALTFCNPAEEYHLKKIEALIRMKIPVLPLPPEVEVLPTEFEEQQAMLREIDRQKRKENPDFQGAFHEKKAKNRKRSKK
ncbi:MAG: DEAD/DEAH box helicase [Flammeovirgaceae bacterium]|nr:DEAD/DEAH box helicase [Flammeovirgaceae bacterium]MDW8287200.1 DEAD/DEAH box helicase [Flammeovirgaceae bacterium]